MTYKSSTAYAWGIYAGILLLELVADYMIRTTGDNFYVSGIPEPMWFLLQILAATIGGWFILNGAKYLNTIRLKVAHVVINFIAGIIFYSLIVYSYVLGLGIDSL